MNKDTSLGLIKIFLCPFSVLGLAADRHRLLHWRLMYSNVVPITVFLASYFYNPVVYYCYTLGCGHVESETYNLFIIDPCFICYQSWNLLDGCSVQPTFLFFTLWSFFFNRRMKVSIIHIMWKLNLMTRCNWHCVDAFI
jgi:hypothetical protein